MDNDEGKDEDTLVFQNLTPEKPANKFQKRIIQMQQNWPPHWSKRQKLFGITVLSGLLIFFLVFAYISISRGQIDTKNITTNGNTIATTDVAQMLSYANVLYILTNRTTNTDAQLEALNAQTGKLIWSYTRHDIEGIQLFNNMLYIQSSSDLVALNANTRAQVWENQTFSDVTHWQTDQGILFTPATNGLVTALNASTGTELWQTNQLVAQWKVDHGIFYVIPTTWTGLKAFDAHNGALLWDNQKLAYQNVSINNGHYYIQDTQQQRIQAFNGSNDKQLWQFNTHGKTFDLTAQNGFLLLSNVKDTQVEALNDQTGQLLWQHPGTLNPAMAEGPNQTILSSLQQNEIDILQTNSGKVLSHFLHTNVDTPSVVTLLALANGLAFFLSYTQNGSVQYIDPKIVAVRISTGATVWSSQESTYISPLQNNEIDIIPVGGNALIALRADNGQPLWKHTFSPTGI